MTKGRCYVVSSSDEHTCVNCERKTYENVGKLIDGGWWCFNCANGNWPRREMLTSNEKPTRDEWTMKGELSLRGPNYSPMPFESRWVRAEWADAEIGRLQAKVDALMLEYCPSEMTDAQREEWAKHQHPRNETSEQRAQDERTLRRLLAFAYSGSALYGDDGELQDGRHPMIDYVRDSVADIERKIHERGMAKLAAAACPECRYVIGHKAGCGSEKANSVDDGPHCTACGRGYGLHHDMCPVQPL